MPRGPSTKLDPSVDLSYHYTTVDDLPETILWDDFFKTTGPVEIEVGSGKGLFLHTHASGNPTRRYLGNEIIASYARLAAYRLAQSELNNGKVVQGDGLKMFAENIPDECVDVVHVYFPDPWWKERHRKRRVMKPSFIKDIQRTLKPGGILQFWTDVEEYSETTAELIANHSDLKGPFFVPLSDQTTLDGQGDLTEYRTHFERRMLNHEHPVFRNYYKKLGDLAEIPG